MDVEGKAEATWRSAPRRRIVPPRPPPAITSSGLFHLLPSDCLERVLAQLSPPALCQLMAVSRFLRLAASHSALWRKHCVALWPADTFTTAPPSPSTYSSRVHLFRGLTICSTSLGNEAEAASTLVRSMGGTWTDALTSATTHLLCGATHTKKARLALHSRGRIHLVCSNWLHRSVESAQLQPERVFVPRLLHGAVICVSGMPAEARRQVRNLVTRYGGVYDETLRPPRSTQPSTHLLLGSSNSAAIDKLQACKTCTVAASRWKVPVVNIAWLLDTVSLQVPADPLNYLRH
ncbi:hypothetical protein AB1Y20_022280 [Prymnesium parvum]|uniref:BRCT domain-containing protein n=1 Tax=Prymnesium parvum TaxID=97485 RepID=A0AB34JJ27_PRYPA